MTKKNMMVILSGPSCVGKGPIIDALRRYHPEIEYAKVVLYNSRQPRLKKSGEREVDGADYHFVSPGLFPCLDRDRFIMGNVRSDIQAIDMDEIRRLLQENDIVLIEVYYTLGQALMEWASRQSDLDFSIRSVFISPLSEEEIRRGAQERCCQPQELVYETMRGKLERRREDLPPKIEERASSAFEEIQAAKKIYTHVIINHAGEDARGEWFGPCLGDEARRVLEEFVSILTTPEETKKEAITVSTSTTGTRKRFRAVLWDYQEGCPGGGGSYSTLSYEQLPSSEWYDTYEEAQEEGKRMNAERDYDWFVRIEEENA